MILDLTAVRVRLHSREPAITTEWREAFANWLLPDSSDYDVALQLDVADTFPRISAPEIYRDATQALTIYANTNTDCFWFRFHDGAQVAAPLGENVVINGQIAPVMWRNGRLTDVTYTVLSPLLRRRGLFLVHAFAAARNGRCVLLVGPSGSGKTTAGLSLLQHSWRLLGNDVILLRSRADAVYALPTPGRVQIRPQTQMLLPTVDVAAQWAPPTAVATLCFPQIVPSAPSRLHALPPAVGLARLMAESVDRWDAATLPAHVACLRRLCAQTAVFTLQSGTDVATWPQLLTENA